MTDTTGNSGSGAANGVVNGTSGADNMQPGFVDRDGDRIDAASNTIAAGAGNDTVDAGAGDDTVFGGSGDDSVKGNDGDDLIYGDTGNSEGPAVVRESFEWDLAPDPNGSDPIDNNDDLSGGFTQNTGNVNVTFSIDAEYLDTVTRFETDDQLTSGIEGDGTAIDRNSSLESVIYDDTGCVNYALNFDTPVENASFRVNDIDFDSTVRILAYDMDGNPIPVELDGGSCLNLFDTDGVAGVDTADSQGGGGSDNDPTYSLLVNIPGPVSRIVIEHEQDGPANSGINVTDVYYDVTVADIFGVTIYSGEAAGLSAPSSTALGFSICSITPIIGNTLVICILVKILFRHRNLQWRSIKRPYLE